jgi:hypothetical protein
MAPSLFGLSGMRKRSIPPGADLSTKKTAGVVTRSSSPDLVVLNFFPFYADASIDADSIFVRQRRLQRRENRENQLLHTGESFPNPLLPAGCALLRNRNSYFSAVQAGGH